MGAAGGGGVRSWGGGPGTGGGRQHSFPSGLRVISVCPGFISATLLGKANVLY